MTLKTRYTVFVLYIELWFDLLRSPLRVFFWKLSHELSGHFICFRVTDQKEINMTLSRRFVFKTIFGGTAAVATLAVENQGQELIEAMLNHHYTMQRDNDTDSFVYVKGYNS